MSRGGSKGRGRALLPPSVAASLNSGGHFGGVKKASIFPGSGNNNSGILGISVPPPLFPVIPPFNLIFIQTLFQIEYLRK